MLGRDSADGILAATAYDQAGDKIGSVGRLYMDDTTGDPAWVSVRTGLLGSKESFVPLEGASLDGDRLNVAVTQDAVKNAPQVDLDDEHLGQQDSQQLYGYYGLHQPGAPGTDLPGEPGRTVADTSGWSEPDGPPRADLDDRGGDRGLGGPDTTSAARQDPPIPASAFAPSHDDPAASHDEPVPSQDDPDVQETGQPGLRLRRHVVVEEQTITVPVVREEYVLEGEPELDDARRQSDPDPDPGPSQAPPSRGV